MARLKINYSDSISALGLNYGSSIEEIKEAYRKLAKQYHPDVYELDNGERFKEISAAYRFLKEHPNPPVGLENRDRQHETYRSPNDIQERKRRAYYKQQSQKKASEAAQKVQMFKWLFARLQLFVFIILIFNSLLALDYLLPSVSEEVRVTYINKVRTISNFSDPNTSQSKATYSYEVQLDNGMDFSFRKQINGKLDVNSLVILERSKIFQEAESVSSKKNDIIIYNDYGLFRIFGFLIPVSILLLLAYLFYVKNNDYRITLFLITVIIFVIQLVLLF
jgi:curved DNA-binding protein CbpA